MRIETERLIITEFTLDMARDVCRNSLDEDTGKFVPDEVFRTVEAARETIAFLMSQYGRNDGPLAYPVFTKNSRKNIGYVQMVPMEDGCWEIGYHIAKKHTGSGYATEAVSAFLPVMAETVGTDEVYGICLQENAASRHVLQKCGFIPVFEGTGDYQGRKREIFRGVWKKPRTDPEIRTARLILRPFRESDYDDLYEFLSQLENDEFEGYPGITYENGKKHLNCRIGSDDFYAIVLKDSGKVIGNIFCGKRDYEAREIGYIVNRFYRRKGYAGEALSAVIRYAFRSGAHRIFAECDPRNVCSWKLLEKAGLKREAHFRKNIWFRKDENGMPVWKDTYVYAMLKSDDSGC